MIQLIRKKCKVLKENQILFTPKLDKRTAVVRTFFRSRATTEISENELNGEDLSLFELELQITRNNPGNQSESIINYVINTPENEKKR